MCEVGASTAGAPASRRAASQSGQATVEFALVLPVIAVVAVGLLQVGVSVANQLAVELAAREGARAASVSADVAGAATRAAARTTSLDVTVEATVEATASGEVVAVRVEFVDDVTIPFIGRFIGPIRHSATAFMALEPP